MPGALKLRLRAGDREIEIEGDRRDVDEILTKWWNQVGAADHEESPSGETKSRSRPSKSKKRKIQTKTDSNGYAAGQSESSYDPMLTRSRSGLTSVRSNVKFSTLEIVTTRLH